MRAAPLAILAILLLPAAAAYPDPGAVPRYYDSPCFAAHQRRFVHDFVGLMDPVDAAVTEDAACSLYQEDSAHLVLAVVQSTDGEEMGRYATHLFERWGIGREAQDDGLLVVYSVEQGEVRIEVGYGLEGTVNSLVARDAYEAMAKLKRQKLENGSTEQEASSHALAAGTTALAQFVRANHQGDPAGQRSGGGGLPSFWDYILWVPLAIALLALLARGRRRRRLGVGGMGGLGMGGMGRWGGGRGGGGGFGRGGGGGGFGGGRSGGGGGGGRF